MPLSIFNHPFLLAAAAVFAIGVAVYEIVSKQDENRLRQGNRRPSPPRRRPSPPRRRPSPPDSPNPPKQSLPKKSDKASDSTILAHPKSPENNLRKRNLDQTSPKESSSADSKNEAKVTTVTALKEEYETPSINSNQINNDKKFDDNNYSLNVFDKLINDTKDINGSFKSDEGLTHNICKEDSGSSEDNLLPEDEKKVNRTISDENVHSSKKTNRRRRRLRKSKSAVEKSTHNHTDNKCFVDSKESSSSEEDSYKKRVHEALERDLNAEENNQDNSSLGSSAKVEKENENNPDKSSVNPSAKVEKENVNENNPDNSSACSPATVEEDDIVECNFCRACEERHANTYAYPCNHSYLCENCATRIFRLYKTCTICLGEIEKFVPFAFPK